MAEQHVSIKGMFENEAQTAEAIETLKNESWPIESVHGPIPGHKIMDALKMKKSRVGWFTLAGGIIGFFTGFLLAIFTATRWDLVVGGKPVVSLVPFFIVGFEFTILFAVFGNIIGLITQMQLPDYRIIDSEHYDIRFSSDRFGVITRCEPGRKEDLIGLLEAKGAEIQVMET